MDNTNLINLDALPTEKMTHELYCYLMEADCQGISQELPLGRTGFEAISEGKPLDKSVLIRILDNQIYFLAGTVLSGYYIKKFPLMENKPC
jgi:hypothetical protein